MRVIDFQDDFGALLIARGVPLEFTKVADWKEDGVDRDHALILVDTDDTEHRKFACHDLGNVAVSLYYLEYSAQPHLNKSATKTAAAVLSGLADAWGVPVSPEVRKLASLDLTARERAEILDERRVRYNPPKIAAASAPAPSGPFAKLAEARHSWADLDPFQRHQVSAEMLKAASALPLEVPVEMYRYGGDVLGPHFQEFMEQRQQYSTNPEVVEGYQMLAKVACTCEPDSVVDALYQLDEMAGLRWEGGDRYGEKLADPVRCVYHCDKVAAYSWNYGSEVVNENELFAFPQLREATARFLGTFTDELWERFKKDPVGTFRAMPEQQKILMSRLARQV